MGNAGVKERKRIARRVKTPNWRHFELAVIHLHSRDWLHDRLRRASLGDVVGVYSDWTPLANRGWLFAEDVDRDDPWQFGNFRVT